MLSVLGNKLSLSVGLPKPIVFILRGAVGLQRFLLRLLELSKGLTHLLLTLFHLFVLTLLL